MAITSSDDRQFYTAMQPCQRLPDFRSDGRRLLEKTTVLTIPLLQYHCDTFRISSQR